MSIFNMVGCVGGSSLNYEVVGGASAPSSPSENTIWVNTSTDITSHIFSATEPQTPVDGMVWISVGASSPVAFSATEENPVMVYPISAKQYVNGAWVNKEAKTYQGGKWVDWYTFIFQSGVGAVMQMQFWKYTSASTGAMNDTTSTNIDVNGITFDKETTSYGVQSAFTVETVDLTDVDTLYCKARHIKNIGDGLSLFVVASLPNNKGETYQHAAASVSISQTDDLQTYALDVRNFTGRYHVGIGGNGSGYVSDIWY